MRRTNEARELYGHPCPAPPSQSLLKRIPDTTFSSATLIAALFVVGLILLRMSSILLPYELNPDESQMLAQGMKFLVDPVPWRAVDGTTSGPLNSYLISVFLLVGFSPGYILAHALATGLVCLQVITAYKTALRFQPPGTAAIFILPMVLVYGLPSDISFEFVHYSSELLPVLFLALGFYGLVVTLQEGLERRRSSRALILFLTGLAFGTSVWCKLQALPIAGALGVSALASILLVDRPLRSARRRMTDAAAFCCGALLPASLILGVVAHSGALLDFWNSYILGNLSHAGPRGLYQVLARCIKVIRSVFLFLPLDLLAFGLLFYLNRGRGLRVSARDFWIFGCTVLYVAAALFAVCRPTTDFPHYTIFLLHPLTYLPLVSAPRNMRFFGRNRTALPKMAIGIVIVAVILFAASLMRRSVRYVQYVQSVHPHRVAHERIDKVVESMKKGRRVRSLAIWGWEPGVYVLSGIPPATRDAIGDYQITRGWVQGYFRHRFVDDLRRNKPDLFIDAVSFGAFMWPIEGSAWSEKDGYESDGELRRFVDGNYVLTEKLSLTPGSKPVRFFTRRETTASE
jgi:hypothetical protein